MAVITLAQYKTLLGITDVDATRDARIEALIPQVEQDIVDYCNNPFRNTDVVYSGDVTPDETGGAYSFNGTAFTDVEFAAGDIIEVVGTIRNDGRFTISTITATKITVSEIVVDEAEVEVLIYLVQFDTAVRLYAARMIAYQIEHMANAGLNSETIKTYKYTRQEKDSFFYPQEILTGLNKWRYIKTGRGSRIAQYNERRGTFVGGEIAP